MNKQQKESYNETEARFVEESKHFASLTYQERESLLNKLHRYEKTLHRINENACNGWPNGQGYENQEWRKKDEKTEKRIESKVVEIAKALGFGIRFNGDPRGNAICFLLPSGRYNSWDGETWRLYW